MSFQLKRTLCSKIFATGPSELGNVVCQMENQTKSRKNQNDYILQAHARQKNRTQPKTVWRDSKSLSSIEISRDYFRLPTHFQKAIRGHPGPLQYQDHRLRLRASKKWGPSPSTLIQIYKQCVRPVFEIRLPFDHYYLGLYHQQNLTVPKLVYSACPSFTKIHLF